MRCVSSTRRLPNADSRDGPDSRAVLHFQRNLRLLTKRMRFPCDSHQFPPMERLVAKHKIPPTVFVNQGHA